MVSSCAKLINDELYYYNMTDSSTLREIIHDGEWLLDQEEKIVERDLAGNLLTRSKFNIVEIATGVRRSGKSTILLWIGRSLRRKGKRVYYINFEDDRFFPDLTSTSPANQRLSNIEQIQMDPLQLCP